MCFCLYAQINRLVVCRYQLEAYTTHSTWLQQRIAKSVIYKHIRWRASEREKIPQIFFFISQMGFWFEMQPFLLDCIILLIKVLFSVISFFSPATWFLGDSVVVMDM